VQVICEKGFEVYDELRPLEWYVSPGAMFPELETDLQKEAPNRKRVIDGFIILFIALMLAVVLCKLCIPAENGQPFRCKMANHSGPKWPMIPAKNGRNLSKA
jgi:hypothetical protein